MITNESDPVPTPPVAIWSIPVPCELKALAKDGSPMAIERALRPVRAWSEAALAGRVVGDVCLADRSGQQPQLGFPIGETLSVYGGPDRILETCCDCPANVIPSHEVRRFGRERLAAGCYGETALPSRGDDFWLRLSSAAVTADETSILGYPPTKPSWYGLFMVPRWEREQQQAFAQLIEDLELDGPLVDRREKVGPWDCEAGFHRLSHAVEIALKHRFPIDVTLVPAGRQIGRSWHWDAHCSACKSSMEPTQRHCSVCGKHAYPYPASKRCARGTRPFLPLDVFLSPTEIKSLGLTENNAEVSSDSIDRELT